MGRLETITVRIVLTHVKLSSRYQHFHCPRSFFCDKNYDGLDIGSNPKTTTTTVTQMVCEIDIFTLLTKSCSSFQQRESATRVWFWDLIVPTKSWKSKEVSLVWHKKLKASQLYRKTSRVCLTLKVLFWKVQAEVPHILFATYTVLP